MEVKSFDTILNELCDDFDSLISPKSISRSNTNVIYLIFKAIAKGFEVINNVCVSIVGKFDPLKCSNEDLDSVAKLVGTERLLGSASGLKITVTNNSLDTLTLLAGEYFYDFDEDTTFSFELQSDVEVTAGSNVTYIAMSEDYGSYPVTAQNDIDVHSENEIPSDFSFACGDNSALLGTTDETDLEFRERINTDTNRQNSLVELQTTLRNLPYIFDCKIKFNNTLNSIIYDGYTIPAYSMAIFFSGEPRNDIAQIVAQKGLYPTLETEDSFELSYYNEVFVGGAYSVYVIPFKKKEYTVRVTYKIDEVFASANKIESAIRTALFNQLNANVHKDYIKENDVYSIIKSLNLAGADTLNVDLYVDGTAVDYVEVPLSRIPELTAVTFLEV